MTAEISKIEDKSNEISKVRRKRGRSIRMKSSEDSLGSNVRLYQSTWARLRDLETEANQNGPRRVYARDIIDAGLKKVETSDLEGLRKRRATVRDQFLEKLKEFQSSQTGATEEAFLAHLLGLSSHQTSTNKT